MSLWRRNGRGLLHGRRGAADARRFLRESERRFANLCSVGSAARNRSPSKGNVSNSWPRTSGAADSTLLQSRSGVWKRRRQGTRSEHRDHHRKKAGQRGELNSSHKKQPACKQKLTARAGRAMNSPHSFQLFSHSIAIQPDGLPSPPAMGPCTPTDFA